MKTPLILGIVLIVVCLALVTVFASMGAWVTWVGGAAGVVGAILLGVYIGARVRARRGLRNNESPDSTH